MNFIPAAEATVKEEEEQDEGVRNEKPAVVIKKKRQKKKQQRAPRAKKEEEISPLKEEELEEEEYSHEIWPMGFSDEEDALSDGDVKEDDLDAEEQLPYPPSKERSKRPRKGALRKQRSDTKLKSPESKLPLEERQVITEGIKSPGMFENKEKNRNILYFKVMLRFFLFFCFFFAKRCCVRFVAAASPTTILANTSKVSTGQLSGSTSVTNARRPLLVPRTWDGTLREFMALRETISATYAQNFLKLKGK